MRSTPVSLEVRIDPALAPVGGAGRLEAPLAAMLESLLESLGLHAATSVSVAPTAPGRPLRVTLSARSVPVSARTLRAAWLAVAPVSERHWTDPDSLSEPGFPHGWLEHVLGTGPDPDVVQNFVVEAVRGTLCELPSYLVNGETVGAYVGGGVAPSELETTLRALVGRGISVRDRSAVLDALNQGRLRGTPLVDIIEVLATRLRDAVVQMQVSAADAAAYGLDVSSGAEAAEDPEPESTDAEFLTFLAKELHRLTGIAFPALTWVVDPSLPTGVFAVRVNSLSGLPRPGLPEGELFVTDSPGALTDLGIRARSTAVVLGIPAPRSDGAATGSIASAADRQALIENGLIGYDSRQFALISALRELVRHADRLLDLEEAESDLGVVATIFPTLVGEAGRHATSGQYTALLRSLLAERVPITNLQYILERALAFDPAQDGGHGANVSEFVRRGLGPLITHRQAEDTGGILQVIYADPAAECDARAIADDPYSPANAAKAERVRDRVWSEITGHREEDVVLVTSSGARSSMQAILAPELPGLTIMDAEEVTGPVPVEVLGTVGSGADRPPAP